MDIKRELIKKAVQECVDKGAKVLYSGGVFKIHDTKKGTAKRILVVTNSYITYFKIGSKPIEDRKHYWTKITSFDFKDDTIELTFDDSPFRFQSPQIEKIAGTLMEIFFRCFTQDELAPLDLSRFPHPPITVNASGILNRFAIFLEYENVKCNPETYKEFTNFVSYMKPSYTLRDSGKLAKLTLSTIRAAPFLRILIVQTAGSTQNLYQSLQEFLEKPSNTRLIVLSNRPDDHYVEFSQVLYKSPITGLSFVDVELEDGDLNRIKNTIIEGNIKSFSLISSLQANQIPTFTKDFLSKDITSHLMYLNLDKTENLHIDSIISKAKRLSVLSLSDCKVDITEVLESLSKSNNQSLRYINLSHNIFSRSCNQLNLSPYLERIDVNHVKWYNSTLTHFLNTILNHKPTNGLRLYINRIQIDENEWSNVFDAFKTITNYPLVEFSWNHNHISSELFTYLQNNIQLIYLFMNSCFTYENEDSINQFGQILPNLSNLTHLVIKGDNEGYRLEENASIIVENMLKMSKIDYVDLSNNKLGQEGVINLSNLITECPTISNLVFDNSLIGSLDCINKLIEAGEKRKKPLTISWPENDIEELLSSSVIQQAEIDEIKEKLLKLATGIISAKTIALRNASIEFFRDLTNPREKKIGKARSRSVRTERNVRNVRTGSFRGVQRPDLLQSDRSLMDVNPDSPLNRTIEAYKSYFTHKFPAYLTDEILDYFAITPIPELEIKSESEIENQPDNEIEPQPKEEEERNEIVTKSIEQVERQIEQPKEENEDDDIIELSLLTDPDIPFIPQLTFPKTSYKFISNDSRQKNQNKLNLPKLKVLGRAPPILSSEKLRNNQNITNEEREDDQIDKSSLEINEDTKELLIIKPSLRTEELSDFESSISDESENEFDVIGQFKQDVSDDLEEGDQVQAFHLIDGNENLKSLPDEVPSILQYQTPSWGFPIHYSTSLSNQKYKTEFEERYALNTILQELDEE